MPSTQPSIAGIVFDFDGTLTRPEALDFAHLRQVTGCPHGEPILEYIDRLPTAAARADAHRKLHLAELAAAQASHPNADAEACIAWCRQRRFKLGILTRNSTAAIAAALANFTAVKLTDFAIVVSRDDPARPKPAPDGVLLAAKAMAVPPDALLVVGDFRFDIEAGQAAGARTAYLTNGTSPPRFAIEPDFIIHRLSELTTLPCLRSPGNPADGAGKQPPA